MPADDEKVLRLRALRETVISSVNSLYHQAENVRGDPLLYSGFKIRYRGIEKWKNAFEKYHIALISVISGQEGAEVTLAGELDIYRDFEEKCQYIETVYYELFELPEEEQFNRSLKNMDKSSNVKLPKINLLTFEGDIKKFPSFISNFNSLVHENQSLSNIEKFNYLTSVLKGQPLNLVKNLPLLDENYFIAYDSLISRYQNKRLLATAYWKEIDNFRPIANDKSLRSLLDVFHENLSALKLLGFPVDQWNFILMQMLIDRLDSHTLKVFEREYASSDLPSYDTVRDILLKHCVVVESISLNSKTKERLSNENKSKFSFNKSSFLSTSAKSTTTGESRERLNCIHCRGDHIVFKCPEFLSKDPHERYEIIKNLKACINCLADSHATMNCTSTKKCRTCNKTHHSLLHFPPKPSTSFTSQSIPSTSAHSSHEIQSFNSFIAQPEYQLYHKFYSLLLN